MPYIKTTSQSLGIKLDAVPADPVSVVASFAELRFVDGKVRYFDPESQLLTLDDDAIKDLVDPVDGSNKGRQLYELQLHYASAAPIAVGLYFVVSDGDDEGEHLFWKVNLSRADNFGYGEKGFYTLDGCGQLKTASHSCGAGGGSVSRDIGDGVNTSFNVNHGFGTYDLVWSVRANDSPYTFVDVDVSLPTLNTATFGGFVSAPGDADYRATLLEGDFAQSFGDGSATSFTVQHNLGTQDVYCAVWDAATHVSVSVDISHTDSDNVTVGPFETAPTTNQYRLVVKKANSTVSGGFATSFGDASATSFTITHGKGTQDYVSTVYDTTSPHPEVDTTITATTADTVTLSDYPSAPAISQYRFVMAS